MRRGNGNPKGDTKGLRADTIKASSGEPSRSSRAAPGGAEIPAGVERAFPGGDLPDSLREFWSWLEAIRVDSWTNPETGREPTSRYARLLFSSLNLETAWSVYAMAEELTGSMEIAARARLLRAASHAALGEMLHEMHEGDSRASQSETYDAVEAAMVKRDAICKYSAADISKVLGNEGKVT